MKLKFSLIAVFIMGFAASLSAQNLSNIDFKNLEVDQLSKEQVQKINQQIEQKGLTVKQAVQIAVSKGLPRSQAVKLNRRLNEAQLNKEGNVSFRENRLRTNPADTGKTQQFLPDNLLTNPGGKNIPSNSSFSQYLSSQDSIFVVHQRLRDKIFGYGLFSQNAAPFEPSLNIPTPDNYQLGPGDELIIDIYGAAERTYNLQVSPDGQVIIEKLGPVYVNGLTIDEAKKRLKNQLSKIYSGLNANNEANQNTHMQVSLGQIRSINVSVIGEAAKPGTYTLPSLATVFNALYSSGGPTVKGSFRNIDIIRGDSVYSTFDLYDLLINGDRAKNIRLHDQDIIKINPYVNRVKIEGEVKRPGIYEMKKSGTLSRLLKYAGGFTGDAYTSGIKVIGSTDRERRINDISKKNYDDFILKNGDLVNVQKVLSRFSNMVQIKGAVFRSGRYELTDTTTVYSLIKQADGLRGDAFKNRGLIYRQQNNYTLKTINFDVAKVMQSPQKNDIKLKKNDLVVISSIFDMRGQNYISIKGPVQKPGRYQFAKGMTLKDLLLQANGFRKKATPRRIEVARRVTNQNNDAPSSQIAKIYHFDVNKNLKLGPKNAHFKLHPYDIVYVRRAPNYTRQQQVSVAGEVRYPGTYTLASKNDRISNIIKRAGGLTKDAYAKGAALYRKLPELQKNANNKQGIFTQKSDSLQNANRNKPKNVTISKVGIKLPEILSHPGSKYDFFLQKKDSLFVPKKLQTVLVKGGVFYPTSIRYDNHLSYKDYITAAGGYNELAKKNNSYIVYANGNVNRVKKFLFFKNYPDVKPGATLVVPEHKKKRGLSPQARVGIYSAIVSTIAVISTTIFQISR